MCQKERERSGRNERKIQREEESEREGDGGRIDRGQRREGK